jgi:hypothetical protein
MSGGRPPRAGRPAPRSSAAQGDAVVLEQRRMRPPLLSSAVEEVDLGEIRTATPAGWTLPCARPLDTAPRSRAAQATLAGCVVSVCSDANDRKTRETQAASGKNIYSLLHCYPL